MKKDQKLENCGGILILRATKSTHLNVLAKSENKNEILNKILVTTMEIKDDFPELYQSLNETPLSDSNDNTAIDLNDLTDYLNTIQILLKGQIRMRAFRKRRKDIEPAWRPTAS